MSRFSRLTTALFVMLAPVAASAGVFPGAGTQLAGTWNVTIQIKDCTSGASMGPPFLSLLTFDQGGTMTETTSNAAFYPAVRGPAHGVWAYLGQKRYSVAQEALITSSGALTAIQQIRFVLEVGKSPVTFKTSLATVSFFKPDGTPTMSGCAAATGALFR